MLNNFHLTSSIVPEHDAFEPGLKMFTYLTLYRYLTLLPYNKICGMCCIPLKSHTISAESHLNSSLKIEQLYAICRPGYDSCPQLWIRICGSEYVPVPKSYDSKLVSEPDLENEVKERVEILWTG